MANRTIIMSDEQLALIVKGMNKLMVVELTEKEAVEAIQLRNMCRETMQMPEVPGLVHGFVL